MGKQSLIEIQKQIFSHIKKRALELELELTDELLRYREDQVALTKLPYHVIEQTELIDEIKHAHVVYLGDFHTFDQNSRNVLRILRSSLSQNKNISLGLELVHAHHQETLDSFIAGHLTEMEFLETINYQESWRFPWGHYRQIFEFAKKEKIKIKALNSEGNLAERDHFAAKIISDSLSSNEIQSMVILFGEYHILRDKLPSQVKKLNQESIKQIIIHQNLDHLYWPLAEANKGHDLNVIKFSSDEFSIQSSPPWVKYESMLYWYDNILEDPEFDLHDIILQANAQKFDENNNDIFMYLYEGIHSFLQFINTGLPDPTDDFNLYDLDNVEYLKNGVLNKYSKEISNFFDTLIQEGKAFKVPSKNFLYCPNYSINQLSYLGGVFALSHLVEDYDSFESDFIKNPKEELITFYFQKSIIGYIGSKIINPYRKTNLYLDFTQMVNNEGIPRLRDCYRGLIEFINDPQSLFNKLSTIDFYTKYLIAKRLGFMCGDLLFMEIRSKNTDQFENLIHGICHKKMTQQSMIEIVDYLKQEANLLKSKKRLF